MGRVEKNIWVIRNLSPCRIFDLSPPLARKNSSGLVHGYSYFYGCIRETHFWAIALGNIFGRGVIRLRNRLRHALSGTFRFSLIKRYSRNLSSYFQPCTKPQIREKSRECESDETRRVFRVINLNIRRSLTETSRFFSIRTSSRPDEYIHSEFTNWEKSRMKVLKRLSSNEPDISRGLLERIGRNVLRWSY